MRDLLSGTAFNEGNLDSITLVFRLDVVVFEITGKNVLKLFYIASMSGYTIILNFKFELRE